MNKQSMLVHNEVLFSINAMLDAINRRIWVVNYAFKDVSAFTKFLHGKAKQFSAQKVIVPAREEDVTALKKQGFMLEGTAEGYLKGAPVNFMTAYPEPQRAISPHLPAKMNTLDVVLTSPTKGPKTLPTGYTCRKATPKDAPALAKLYGKVFSTYPTPLDQTDYVLSSMDNHVLFYAVLYNNKIASVAAAEMDLDNRNAEMTNCATDPAHRGRGLMSVIMTKLEQEATKKDIKCLYSLSRASEFGINLILHRLGYSYRGTLINNCHICGDWEDMHLWVKMKA